MLLRLPLAAFALALAPLEARAVDPGVAEVEACMRRNLPARTSVQTVQLESIDRTGGKRTLEAKIYWKRGDDGMSKTLIEVEAPPSDRGSAYLWLEQPDRNETWVYLPELQRTRRIHPRSADGNLFGTDFSYEDIQHIQRVSSEAGAERLPDAELGDRPVYVVRADTTGSEGSAYDHIVYSIDKESCVPLKMEFFETSEDIRKILKCDPDTIEKQGESYVAKSVDIEDVANGTTSQLRVEKIELDATVRDRLFTVSSLERRGR